MKTLLVSIILLLALFGCQSGKTEESNADSTRVDVAQKKPVNQLTDAQRSEGWRPLFDGRTFEGFRFYKNKENNSWEILDGTLHAKPSSSASNKRADLVTRDQYENFELMFDWKVPTGGNSGVMFRVTEEYDAPYLSGPEYQLIDDEGWPGDPLKDAQLSGSNYDMHAAPANKILNPTGEWNSSRIVANGKHIEHWLNGIKLFEYELESAEWKMLKEKSKWKEANGYGKSRTGLIAFQDHGQEVWFRNVFIRPL